MDSLLDMSISGHVVDIMKCAICLDMPSQPKLLNCAHVFCLECLEGHLAASVNRFLSRRITCPQCRQASNIPSGDLSKLPTDFRALQIGELLEKRQHAKTKKKVKPVQEIELEFDLAGPEPIPQLDPEEVKNVAKHLHGLIRYNTPAAKDLLDNKCTEERSLIAAEMVGINTALTLCIEVGNFEMMTYLITECGADVEQRCDGTIASGGERQVVSGPPIGKAVHSKNLHAIQILLLHGADVNAQDTEGWSALHLASRKADISIVKCLVNAGADVNMQDSLGITCLMNAKSRPEIRSYLLSQGADPNLPNVNGGTVLHYATLEGCAQSVRALLEHGADASVIGSGGDTVLHSAVASGYDDIVQVLLEFGADPYIKNEKNEDCFLTAVLGDRYIILKSLVRKHKATFYN